MILDIDALIRQRAYEIWEMEGRPEGRDREHWFQAAQGVVSVEARAVPGLKPARSKAASPAAPAPRKKAPAVTPARKKKQPT